MPLHDERLKIKINDSLFGGRKSQMTGRSSNNDWIDLYSFLGGCSFTWMKYILQKWWLQQVVELFFSVEFVDFPSVEKPGMDTWHWKDSGYVYNPQRKPSYLFGKSFALREGQAHSNLLWLTYTYTQNDLLAWRWQLNFKMSASQYQVTGDWSTLNWKKKQPSFVAFGLKCLVLLTAEWRCGNVLVLILVA